MKLLQPVSVDGQLQSAQWPLDRGLQYGDGLFETMLMRGGQLRFLGLHLTRLRSGCERLGINLDLDATRAELESLASQHLDGTLKLVVTRGNAIERGYRPTGREQARRIVYAFAEEPASPQRQPFTVSALTSGLGENPLLAGLKHLNRLEQVLARQELARRGGDEGLQASSTGRLICGTMSNVFLKVSGVWQTPRLDRCGIAGVMRAVVLREAPALNLEIQETDLPMAMLANCEQMFLTNARWGVQPVQVCEGRALKIGTRLHRLMNTVDALNA